MMRARPTVLATLTALVVGTVTLAVVAWAAEGGGAPALAATTDESALCQNPQQVLVPATFSGDNTTNTFTTTTNVFRVNYASSPALPAGSTATIRILDEAFQSVASAEIDADADTSVSFNLDPGTYRVEVNIEPESAEDVVTYTVSVDECGGTTTAPTTKEDCKNGGYAKYGFKNQGQCIKAVNHAS
jgi:hypothetical protein